jgi:uncharacterized protein (DUF2164 family)
VVRAVYAAERLLRSFNNFKESFWRDLTHDASDAVKLRMAIALGPVVSINMGSLQNAAPTVMGPCVNRSAKMVAHAPRDRDVVLVDENASKALSQQKNQRYVSALTPHQWHNESVAGFPFMRDGSYFELELNLEKLPPLEFRPLSRFSHLLTKFRNRTDWFFARKRVTMHDQYSLPPVPTMTIEISSEATNAAISSIQRYFQENMDEPIGSLEARSLLSFMLKEIGPVVYNKAIADAQARLQERVAELDVEIYEEEFSYWTKGRKGQR